MTKPKQIKIHEHPFFWLWNVLYPRREKSGKPAPYWDPWFTSTNSTRGLQSDDPAAAVPPPGQLNSNRDRPNSAATYTVKNDKWTDHAREWEVKTLKTLKP